MLMVYYYIGWKQLPIPHFNPTELKTSVVIIIPARNEAQNILQILQDILKQNFPKKLIEVIVVDDHSTDNTSNIAQTFLSNQHQIQFQILSLADAGNIHQAYKKKAIEFAISKTKATLIITTDADCRLPANWLHRLVSHYETTQHKMIAAPVKFNFDNSFFQQFQALDFIGLMGITGASIQKGFYNMCNGANLCYERKAFFEVNGFKGNDNISSGDDMFLMHKMATHFANNISFLKLNDACVITHPKESVNEFIQQRLRWTGKSTSYSDHRITAILVIAYLFNVSILCNFILLFIIPKMAFIFVIQIVLKAIVEFVFLHSVSNFFQQKKLMRILIPAQILHIGYVITIGIAGQLFSFDWKGRNIKK